MPYDYRSLEADSKKVMRGMRKFVQTERRVRKIHVILALLLVISVIVAVVRVALFG